MHLGLLWRDVRRLSIATLEAFLEKTESEAKREEGRKLVEQL